MREAAATTSIASSMMRVAPRSVGLQNGVRWNPIFMGVPSGIPLPHRGRGQGEGPNAEGAIQSDQSPAA